MLLRAWLPLLLAVGCGAFYLPGVAPREYFEDENVTVKVNSIKSTETAIPYGRGMANKISRGQLLTPLLMQICVRLSLGLLLFHLCRSFVLSKVVQWAYFFVYYHQLQIVESIFFVRFARP